MATHSVTFAIRRRSADFVCEAFFDGERFAAEVVPTLEAVSGWKREMQSYAHDVLTRAQGAQA